MRVAVLFIGRIKAWQYCKESLKRLQNTYNATFFLSLNATGPDESSDAFCKFFDVTPERIIYIPTVTPEKYRQIFHGREHNAYAQWFQIHNVFRLMESFCEKHSVSYDCIVKYRADIDTTETLQIPIPLEPNRFYSQVHDAYQTHDLMAYGDFLTMKRYSELVLFYEFFYQNNMLMYGERKHLVKPTEMILFDYICLLATTVTPKIDIIYFNLPYLLHPKRLLDEPFSLNPVE